MTEVDQLALVGELLNGRKFLPNQTDYVQKITLFGVNGVVTINTPVLANANQSDRGDTNSNHQPPSLEMYPYVSQILGKGKILPDHIDVVEVLASLDERAHVFFTVIPLKDLDPVKGRLRLTPTSGIVTVSLFEPEKDAVILPRDTRPEAQLAEQIGLYARQNSGPLIRELCLITLNFGPKKGALLLPPEATARKNPK